MRKKRRKSPSAPSQASAPSAFRTERFSYPRRCSGYLRFADAGHRKRRAQEGHRTSGRIIPDPNASGYVQSAVGGRLSAPPGGFPRLGTRVKQGDILGYVTPPIQAIDVSDMRQRQGELDQQISIVERRFARYEQLAPGGAISRTQLEDTRLELEGLRERRAAIDKSRRDPEPLIAPVAGVIAEGSAVAGQIVQPSSVVFNIIDPSQLWVEALSFGEHRTFAGRAGLDLYGQELRPGLSRHRLCRSQPIGAGAFCRDRRYRGVARRPVPHRAGRDR